MKLAAKFARIVLALGLMVFLAWKVDVAALQVTLTTLPVASLVGLVGLTSVMQVLFARRLQILIQSVVQQRGAGVRLPTLRAVLADQLVSAAAGSVLPSSVGADVLRVVLVGDYVAGGEARARGASIILVDRIVGLLAMCTPPLMLALWWGKSAFSSAVVVVGALLLVVAWKLETVLRFVPRLVPARWANLRAFAEALPLGAAEVTTGARVQAFAWSVLCQLCVGLFFEVVAASWGPDGRYHEAIWVGIPAAMVLTVVPLSIGGFGLRESLFVGVFALLGLPREQGLVLGLLWGTQALAWSLVGAVVLLVRRRMTREVVSEPVR